MSNPHTAHGMPPAPEPSHSAAPTASSPPEADRDDDGSRKVIKRYSNRKLYDTATSKYVTLDDIAQMVKAGEDVRIVDNETKEDLTSVTLTQIIYEEEKTARRVPLGMLRNIIQSGGETLNDFFDRSSRSVESSVSELRQGALSIKGALADLGDTARRYLSPEARQADEFRRSVWSAVDQIDARLEARIQQVVGARSAGDEVTARELETHVGETVTQLRNRVAALSVMIDRLERAARGDEPSDEI